jgi:hypothetical protein
MKTTNFLIESMLDSTIGRDDKEHLKYKLNQSSTLRKEFKLRKEINCAIIENDVEKLRQCLDVALADMEIIEHKRYQVFTIGKTKRIFWAAATISGITVGGLALYSTLNSSNSSEQLYKEFFAPYPPTYTSRDAIEGKGNLTFDRAMVMYQRAKHKDASESLKVLLKQQPNSVAVKFYLAITLMQLDEFDAALPLLNDIIAEENLYSNYAKWYKGLSCLALDDLNQAKELFNELKYTEGELAESSKLIIKKLED